VADVYSRRASVIAGTCLMGVAYLGQAAVPTFAAMLAAQVVWGIGYTFTSGAYDAWVVDEIGAARAGDAFVRAGQVARAASIAGLGLGAALGAIHLALPVAVGGAGVLLTGAFLLLWMPERAFAPTPLAKRTTWRHARETLVDGLRVIRARPPLRRILGVSVFYGLYSEAWDRLWQAHLIGSVGLPALGELPAVVWLNAIMIAEMLLGIAAGEALRRRLDLTDGAAMARALRWMTAAMVAGLVVYGLAATFPVALAALLTFTVARGLTGPVYGTWSNLHIDSSVRATVLSMQSQVDAVGQILGGPPLGALGARRLPLAFLASAAILSPALWLLARSERADRAGVDPG
jgi:DHA3 family tetracycline resistance protein-like MFS transporter